MQDMTLLFQTISTCVYKKNKIKSFKTRGEANEGKLQVWENCFDGEKLTQEYKLYKHR